MASQRDQLTVIHGMAEVEPQLRIHYVTAGDGPRTIVLLHGFPQTWWEWRSVIPALVEAGFRVVAPDYRGAGHSGRPAAGYDKATMAGDVHRLVRDHLGIAEPVVVVGHDIGLMVAYSYARRYQDDVSHLAVIDAPLPGTTVFDRLSSDPRVWQFAFHAVRDIPEMLIAGREGPYLQHFFTTRSADPSAITAEDLDVYVAAYAAPGGIRAGMELYRAFDQDAADNRATLEQDRKLALPVLSVGGAISTTGRLMDPMMREVADNVTALLVDGAGHWIPEEQPSVLAKALHEFASEMTAPAVARD
jgi:pimeloyl-ACP methyl ester carboxylesterase